MKIVATSDTHFPVNVKRKGWFPEADVFIHAGDLMWRGSPDEWKPLLKWLDDLPYKVKIYVPGNHDRHLEVYQGSALQDLRRVGVKVIGFPGNHNYDSIELPNGMSLLGLPYVTNLPRWCFNKDEEYLRDFLSWKGRHDIIVSHSPAYGILDQLENGKSVGIGAYAEYLMKHNPKYWINGHIHESYGTTEIADCKFYNVSMCNRAYKQVNKPIIIDI